MYFNFSSKIFQGSVQRGHARRVPPECTVREMVCLGPLDLVVMDGTAKEVLPGI